MKLINDTLYDWRTQGWSTPFIHTCLIYYTTSFRKWLWISCWFFVYLKFCSNQEYQYVGLHSIWSSTVGWHVMSFEEMTSYRISWRFLKRVVVRNASFLTEGGLLFLLLPHSYCLFSVYLSYLIFSDCI